MATNTIGTSSRDYSTKTLWEAASLSSGDIGECYDDSAFDDSTTYNVTTNLILRAATGEGHDGTAGSGARDVKTGSGNVYTVQVGAGGITIQLLEADANGNAVTRLVDCNYNGIGADLHRLLLHGQAGVAFDNECVRIGDATATNAVNCVAYDGAGIDGGNSAGFRGDFLYSSGAGFDNCTAHDFTHSVGNGYGFRAADITGCTMRNNVSTDAGTQDYETTSYSNATVSHNLASDTSASGTGSLTSKAAADQYVSTTGGSEDLHLKTGADAIDAGTDLGTSPTNVNVDIDGRDRDSEGDTWDMGAHEFVDDLDYTGATISQIQSGGWVGRVIV